MAKTLKSEAHSSRRTVFIVEDHPIFCEGLADILNDEPDLMLCGTAGDAEAALGRINQLKPDLVLVDITLPGKNGLELIKELRAVNRRIKLLVLSMHDEALYADRVLRAGGDGYIMKQEDPDEIVQAIRDVLDGHIYVSEEVMAAAQKNPQSHALITGKRSFDQLSDSDLETSEIPTPEEIRQQLPVNFAKGTQTGGLPAGRPKKH